MLSCPLRHLYQAAHKYGKDQLQICLQMEPVKVVLYSTFCYPYVTREAAEKEPALLDKMRAMLTLSWTNPLESFG